MKRGLFLLGLVVVAAMSFAQPQASYYTASTLDGKNGRDLELALQAIVYPHTRISYGHLWESYETTDLAPMDSIPASYTGENIMLVYDMYAWMKWFPKFYEDNDHSQTGGINRESGDVFDAIGHSGVAFDRERAALDHAEGAALHDEADAFERDGVGERTAGHDDAVAFADSGDRLVNRVERVEAELEIDAVIGGTGRGGRVRAVQVDIGRIAGAEGQDAVAVVDGEVLDRRG